MVSVAQDLSIHLPRVIAQIIINYIDLIENALKSLSRKKNWFQYDYCFSGECISDVSAYVYYYKPAQEFLIRALEVKGDDRSSLPDERDIVDEVKKRGKKYFLGQQNSFGYQVANLTDELLGYPHYRIGRTKTQKRRYRRKKQYAWNLAFRT